MPSRGEGKKAASGAVAAGKVFSMASGLWGSIVFVRAQSVLARWAYLSKMCVPPGMAVAVYGVGGAYLNCTEKRERCER